MKSRYKVLVGVVAIVAGWLLLGFGYGVSGHPLLAGVSFLSGLFLSGGGVVYIIIVCTNSAASAENR